MERTFPFAYSCNCLGVNI